MQRANLQKGQFNWIHLTTQWLTKPVMERSRYETSQRSIKLSSYHNCLHYFCIRCRLLWISADMFCKKWFCFLGKKQGKILKWLSDPERINRTSFLSVLAFQFQKLCSPPSTPPLQSIISVICLALNVCFNCSSSHYELIQNSTSKFRQYCQYPKENKAMPVP